MQHCLQRWNHSAISICLQNLYFYVFSILYLNWIFSAWFWASMLWEQCQMSGVTLTTSFHPNLWSHIHTRDTHLYLVIHDHITLTSLHSRLVNMNCFGWTNKQACLRWQMKCRSVQSSCSIIFVASKYKSNKKKQLSKGGLKYEVH